MSVEIPVQQHAALGSMFNINVKNVVQLNAGGFVSLSQTTGAYKTADGSEHTLPSYVLTKFDVDGKVLKSVEITNNENVKITGLITLVNGEVIVSGNFKGDIPICSRTLTSAETNAFMLKFTPDTLVCTDAELLTKLPAATGTDGCKAETTAIATDGTEFHIAGYSDDISKCEGFEGKGPKGVWCAHKKSISDQWIKVTPIVPVDDTKITKLTVGAVQLFRDGSNTTVYFAGYITAKESTNLKILGKEASVPSGQGIYLVKILSEASPSFVWLKTANLTDNSAGRIISIEVSGSGVTVTELKEKGVLHLYRFALDGSKYIERISENKPTDSKILNVWPSQEYSRRNRSLFPILYKVEDFKPGRTEKFIIQKAASNGIIQVVPEVSLTARTATDFAIVPLFHRGEAMDWDGTLTFTSPINSLGGPIHVDTSNHVFLVETNQDLAFKIRAGRGLEPSAPTPSTPTTTPTAPTVPTAPTPTVAPTPTAQVPAPVASSGGPTLTTWAVVIIIFLVLGIFGFIGFRYFRSQSLLPGMGRSAPPQQANPTRFNRLDEDYA